MLRAIARYAGLKSVEIRDNPQSDSGLPFLVVDPAQAASYPAYIAEIVPEVGSAAAPPPPFVALPSRDPKIRVLLHYRQDGTASHVSVETLDHCVLGTPQWKLADDSRNEKIRKVAVLALVEHMSPRALGATAPVVLGMCERDGHRYRCSVTRAEGGMVLLTERAEKDQAGVQRWTLDSSTTLTDANGTLLSGFVDADVLIDCAPRC